MRELEERIVSKESVWEEREDGRGGVSIQNLGI